jgi:hypothetical protein
MRKAMSAVVPPVPAMMKINIVIVVGRVPAVLFRHDNAIFIDAASVLAAAKENQGRHNDAKGNA